MNNLQFKRANIIFLMVVTVITFFLSIGLLAQLKLSGMEPYKSIIPLAVTLMVYVGDILVYLKHKETEILSKYIAISFCSVYFIIMMFSVNNALYPYIIPVLIMLTLYKNRNVIVGVSLAFIIVNILELGKIYFLASDVGEAIPIIMPEMIITILTCITVNSFANLSHIFQEETDGKLMNESMIQKQLNNKIVKSAGNIETSINSSIEFIKSVKGMTETLNKALEDISSSTIHTSEAIEVQLTMTNNIQNMIEEAVKNSEEVFVVCSNTDESVIEGVEYISGLNQKAKESQNSSEILKTVSRELKEKSEEVQKITDIILSISDQTNLLALNASIEAARAGEAGKGFAVVADEIRKLSEQTKSATDNIKSILELLFTNADEVSKMVNASVNNSFEQYELIEKTSAKLENVKFDVNKLKDSIGKINNIITNISKSSSQIEDRISTLSATVEEVASSAEQALQSSNKNVEDINNFAENLDSIAVAVKELNE